MFKRKHNHMSVTLLNNATINFNGLEDNCQILAVRSDNCQCGQLSVRTTVSGDNCQWGQLSVAHLSADHGQLSEEIVSALKKM